MNHIAILIFSIILALTTPLITLSKSMTSEQQNFPGWPKKLLEQPLIQVSMDKKEKTFLKNFPGKVGRFTDGERDIIIRWISKATRKLHPVSDCLKATSFKTSPRPIERDKTGRLWGCVNAQKEGQKRIVCEVLFDNNGNSWSDVSSWYWAIMLGRTHGPWWSAVVSREDSL